MIEVEVHQRLRAFLREQGKPYWSHHLTMARLVARALRLQRSALIQTGAACAYHGRYRLSYLVPILMWPGPVILVATEAVQQRLLLVEIPQLRDWIQATKPIQTGDRVPHPDFQGVLLTTPESWLRDRLHHEGRFPAGIPTLIDEVDNLEQWAHNQLTVTLQPADWEVLMQACPLGTEAIRDTRVWLTKALFDHPANPYDCYLIDQTERDRLEELLRTLGGLGYEAKTSTLQATWSRFAIALKAQNQLLWSDLNRQQGQFSLSCGPVAVNSALASIWQQQPVVLVGGAIDQEAEATTYRQRLGLEMDLTCLKFADDRQDDLIHLYLPDGIPMPNTPQYQASLMQELHTLLRFGSINPGLTVVLVDDTPLKAQVGSFLAAEFGSRVQVERTCLDDNGVLVTGWEFWQRHQRVLPTPQLLAIATLPIPSLENPLVAGRVNYYKKLKQDWFRLYLLPAALSELQRAIAPVRERQGVVALLDSRVIHRSYGQQILAALHPLIRFGYLDASLFAQPDYP